MMFGNCELMSENELLENLCAYDIRNPNNVLSTEIEQSDDSCFCDSCFYGTSKLANNFPKTFKNNQK